jgi:LysM repeat protein
MNRNAGRAAARSEVIKFGLLTAVLLLLVLGLALARPLLFGHILPIVLGLPAGGPALDAEVEQGETAVDRADAAYPANAGGDEDSVIVLPMVGGQPAPPEGTSNDNPGAAEATSIPEAPEAAETAVTPPLPSIELIHIVQPGETLTRIAERYNVTVAALVTANGITNPNQIPAGMALRVPQP